MFTTALARVSKNVVSRLSSKTILPTSSSLSSLSFNVPTKNKPQFSPFQNNNKVLSSIPFTQNFSTSTDSANNEISPLQKQQIEFGQSIADMMPHSVYTAIAANGELTLTVPASSIKEVLYFLRDHTSCQFKMLLDICGVDYPERDARFEVVYHLLSIKYNSRIRLKVAVDELTPVDSVVSIFSSAGWYEREVWDLYGVFFSNHPDLRRILTDYGFDGHPMRRDFPLSGHTEIRYDEAEKRIVTEPVELAQEFRVFDFQTPWDQKIEPNIVQHVSGGKGESKE